MSNQPADEEVTLIHDKIVPEKVEQQAAKNDSAEKKQELQRRGESDMHSSLLKSQSDDSLKGKVDLEDSIANDDGQQKEVVEQKKLIPSDYFYPEDHKQEEHPQSSIPEYVVKLDGFFGHDSFKKYNAHILDRDCIIYAAGISYIIYNHFTKERQIFFSRDKGGIAAIAVHPNKKYFAVAEKGVWPKIYIYEYPSLKLYRVMRKGTETSYSCICFSHNGEMLGSVGSDPDYMLNVWDWKQELTILKSKAFSQEVYRVSFSQFNEKWLTTSGTGHIRFWKIAETFTGLKLQGQIAKFGLIELSDVTSYAEFEDGKVLSSSQYGKLLLWEGNMIKSVVGIDAETPCHKGAIQYVRLVRDKIITAGADGYIRFWDYATINTGESDQKFNLFIKPEKQIYFQSPMGTPAYLNWIQMGDHFWIVQDALGALYKYTLAEDKREQIMTFNSGDLNDFAMSPLNNSCVTVGYDGFVRLWDYGNKRQFYARNFGTVAQSTCVDWFPYSKRTHGRMILVGFADGIVRFLLLNERNFQLLHAFKVHKNNIIKVKINRDGSAVVVADSAGSLFFISVSSSSLTDIKPYCLFETGFKINDLCWDRKGQKILLACQDGRLHEIDVPQQQSCDFSETYLREFTSRSYTIKMMDSQKPNKEDLELELLLKKTKGGNVDEVILDQQWQPSAILNAVYFDSNCDKVLCSVEGKFLGHYYIVDFNKDRPIGSLQVSNKKTSFMGLLQEQDLLFVGFRNGSWEIRHKKNPSMYLRKSCYDQDYGVVRKVAINIQKSAIVSLSDDGTMISHKFDLATFQKGAKGDIVEESQVTIPSIILGISEASFVDKIDAPQEENDITDSNIYGLQDQKLKAEEDQKMLDADQIKDRKVKKIKQLQKLFKEIAETNNKETDYLAKLTPEQMIVDPQYANAFQKRIDEEVEETRKQLAWDQQYAEVAKKKLEKYYVDELESLRFRVKGIKTKTIVSSFKFNKLSPFILKEIEKIERIIEEQKALQSKERKDKTQSNFAQSKALMEMTKMKEGKKGAKQENLEVKNKIKQAEAEFQKQLAHAIATKGDFKLKTSRDYIVPDNERLNVSRKKKHLFLHYQYLYMEKHQFNNRLRALRARKLQMVNKLDQINDRIRQINRELNESQEDFSIEIDPKVQNIEEEIVVTEAEVADHILQKQRQKEASKKSGMGMGGGNQPAPEDKKPQQKDQPEVKKVQTKPRQERQSIMIKPRPHAKVKRSALQDEIRQIKKITLRAQRDKIKNDLLEEIQKFDNQLEALRALKYQLQSDLTLVEMKIMTYSQEFIIFRDMEVYDNKLMETLNTFGNEKTTLEQTFVNLTTQINELEEVTDEIRKKFEEEKKILKEFVYPDDEEMRQRIIRYYKIRERKRINRLKKQAEAEQREKESQNEENSQEQEEQQEEQEEEESEDEFEDEDEKPDITVIENDHKNFERVRKICEYDEKIEENSKKKSELEKQRHQVTNKIKSITSQLSKAETELIAFQKKKLQKVNQLLVSYPVKFSQILYNVNIRNKLRPHQDLSSSILFTKNAFKRLGDRIDQLKREKVDIEKKQKNLNKKLTKLTDSVHKASLEIENKKKQYEQKQLLKFGSTFQLQKLKELQPTPQVLDMREIFRKQEREVSNKIQGIKQELQTKKRELLQSKRQNTKVITEITELGDRENDLKKKLDSTNKQLFKNYDVSKKDELQKQRQNLKDLIKFLSKEIEDLKTEIGLFKRKGGHIYTMVTSNKKNFS